MLNRIIRTAAAFLLALDFGQFALAGEAPLVHEALTAQLLYPYDESANAHAELDAALKRAAAAHKFVLLDFGGNWCPDCRTTAGVMALNDVKPWLERTFEVVFIDIGRLNKNLDIGDRYHIHIKAVPTIVILDSQSTMLNSGNPAALKDAREMTPQAIVDTIHGWTETPG